MLRAFGFDVEGVPLAWCTCRYRDTKVQFHEAWPVAYEAGDDVEVVCASQGYPVVVTRKVGMGSLTLIADSCFLLNENLEGAAAHNEANIQFLRDLLQH